MVKAALPPQIYWILMGWIPCSGEATRLTSVGFDSNQHQVDILQITKSPHP